MASRRNCSAVWPPRDALVSVVCWAKARCQASHARSRACPRYRRVPTSVPIATMAAASEIRRSRDRRFGLIACRRILSWGDSKLRPAQTSKECLVVLLPRGAREEVGSFEVRCADRPRERGEVAQSVGYPDGGGYLTGSQRLALQPREVESREHHDPVLVLHGHEVGPPGGAELTYRGRDDVDTFCA